MYTIISSANDSFTSFFKMWMPFTSFSCLITMARTSNTMLNKSCKSRHLCLYPDLKRKVFSLCLLCMMFAVGFSYMAFIMLKYVPSFITLLSVFIINGCCILSNAFSAIYWYDHVVFVHLVYVMYQIYWFENIVPSLHPWNKSHLIMVYDLSDVL